MSNIALSAHRKLLSKWRGAMDLIGPGNMEHHFEDSIGAVSNLDITGRWIDLGSGAGFPGIALAAMYPHIQLQMVESRQKRALFLKRVISEGKLKNITLFHGRTEAIQSQFDGVISRAYKPPIEYLQDADRLCCNEGLAICLLGEDSSFPIPKPWILQSEAFYNVSDGRRKRWVLKKTKNS